ncbi:unnamed protein product [Rotaria sordida]|uniref:Uncharacterized protein n=2 Tax=Rotaria sordida TaxID=392033 RepID=A0A814BKS9_9BILA|nr:unnamed protein product [Rotaria sordida]CAF0799277.1 unnamed protein product [Rotaria sordida]CAF0929674.1 unnamed protein product [Rotaria sordida]CAF3533393.1 unnamed protein product [Rotaria sordida]
MNVLHYSLSLSACPKCHLFICKHTSLADLDLSVTEQQQQQEQSISEDNNTQISTENNLENSYQQRLLHGTNFYIFPSTTNDNYRHSWTTFGTNSIASTNTFHNLSSNNETICENIPFANENIINSLLPPTINQIVRTQSEKFDKKFQKSIYLTKSFSFSTSNNRSLSLVPSIKHNDHLLTKSHSYSNRSLLIIIILILSFLITNTIDIVLLYIYYHTNYIYIISFTSTIILCDMILWINNLIQLNTVPSYLLLIPFSIRPYLLYELVELFTIMFDKYYNRQILNSSSSSSSSTTFETNISHRTDSSMIHHLSLYKRKKQKLFHYLTLFYAIHTGFLTFFNIYFWSNNFQQSTKSLLNMNYFIPQWISNNDYLSSTSMTNTIPSYSSIAHWQIFDNEHKHLARRTMSSDWTQYLFSSFNLMSIHLPSSPTFILTSIFYYLIINYSLLSTFLILERFSFNIILSILSRLFLIITRIYTFIFLFHFNNWLLTMIFFIVHLTLMITRLFHRSKFKHKQNTMFLQMIFSLITHYSIDDITINALISLENLSIFLYCLYLETFSFNHNELTLRLIIFISILISLQIIGFIFDILSKNILYRTKTITIV